MSTFLETAKRLASAELRHAARWFSWSALRLPLAIKRLGLLGGLRFLLLEPLCAILSFAGVRDRRRSYRLHVSGIEGPLECRPFSSDLEAFFHVFIAESYSAVGSETRVHRILDCGANVGFASVWFASRYPSASVVAVEPDPGNFRQLQVNVARYGSRIRTLNAALWAGEDRLVFDSTPFRDGREWSTRVRPAHANEDSEIRGIDLRTLMQANEWSDIDLLKIDIEGARSRFWKRTR